MSKTVVTVENLSKSYLIRRNGPQRHDGLRHVLQEAAMAPWRWMLRLRNGSEQAAGNVGSRAEEFWALRDVSLEIKQGEVVGIIGRNGAGKSTLLKILSRITDPTRGRVHLRGRVASLLEVGTGFHPELTGRENIFLNGAILGMTRVEIKRKFDEIVAFAGVDRFLETPVKRYSSGMYVRLAFAVAAHLEPEILVVDEVLAVGDMEFQKKCLGKMQDVAREGRTILFVSHNLSAVANLCTKALWLDGGCLRMHGPVSETTSAYLNSGRNTGPDCDWKRSGSGEARVTNLELLDFRRKACGTFKMGETLILEFSVDFQKSFSAIDFGLLIRRADTALAVLHLVNEDSGLRIENAGKGVRSFRVKMPNCLLYPGLYTLSIWVGSEETRLDWVEDVLSFTMAISSVSRRTTRLFNDLGTTFQPSCWQEIPANASPGKAPSNVLLLRTASL